MKVAVCETKHTPAARLLREYFTEGLTLHEEEVCLVSDYADIEKVSSQDICYHACWLSYTKIPDGTPEYIYSYGDRQPQESVFRSRLIKEIEDCKKFSIVSEQGYVFHGKSNQKDESNYYVSLGVGGIKRNAHYFNKNSPPDRWKKLQDKASKRGWNHCSEWREDGDHILIVGQNPRGFGTTNIRKRGLSYEQWVVNTVKEMVKHTDRSICYRPHPTRRSKWHQYCRTSLRELDSIPQFSQLSPFKDLQLCLNNCWCVVASASNAAVDAIYAGIPVITSDPMSMVYDISSHDLSEVEYPKREQEDMCQWFYNLAYSQWTHEEIKSGEAWSHIKEGIINENLLSVS